MSEAAPSSKQVLHVDFVSLRPEAGPDARDEIVAALGDIGDVDRLLACRLIEGDTGSDFDLAVCFVLPDFEALEPFGTDERYIRFLQGTLAPRLRAFAGCDVQLDGDFPVDATAGQAACYALALPDETYDWEVRARLSEWLTARPGCNGVVGLAVGERQRYRGLAIALGNSALTVERTGEEASLVSGKLRRLL